MGHPIILEANARLLLRRVSERYGKSLTLGTVPLEYWRELSERYQALWLMGVWERSRASREQALGDASLAAAFTSVLPDWDPRDVDGSPYAIKRYRLDPALGRRDDLSTLRSRLTSQGLKLLLDFVPNHVARDHQWVDEWPDLFVRPTAAEHARHPERYFSASPGVALAHGRDPHHPPWTDTAQLDFASPETRRALISELMQIARVCDGVRCDMAMLAMNETHGRTWGRRMPPREFWGDAIAQVRAEHPAFIFIAEAYWDLEPQLIELGFDYAYAYDKGLYDGLRQGAREARDAVSSDPLGPHALRFTENHDEERAVTALGNDRSFAAAVLAATLLGAFLVLDGQTDGRQRRLPVQLVREPFEPGNTILRGRYDELLRILNEPLMRGGRWIQLEVTSVSPGLFAWMWMDAEARRLVFVNYSPAPEHGHVAIHSSGSERRPLRTLFGTERAKVCTIDDEHVEVDLGPWGASIVDIGRN